MHGIKWSQFPYVRVALCFSLGIGIGEYLNPPVVYTSIALGLFVVYHITTESIQSAVLIRTHITSALVFLAVFVLGGMVRIGLENQKLDQNKSLFDNNRTYIVAGKIIEKMKSSYGYKYLISAGFAKDSSQTIRLNQSVVITFKPQDTNAIYQLGDHIQFEAKPKSIITPQNPAGFDYAYFLRTKGIVTQFAVPVGYHRQVIPTNEWAIYDVPIKHRDKASEILARHIPDEQSRAVAESLLIGTRTNLSAQTSKVFASTGAMHVLAVSGLHVGIFIGLFVFLFGKIKVQQQWFSFVKLLFLLCIITFYVLFTGASPSVVRAGIMISFVLVSRTIYKKSNSYNVLSLTAMGMIIYQPFLLLQPSFQFSFLALISILYFQPYFDKLWYPSHKLFQYFWGLTTVTLAAQILIFPLSVYYFHQFPLVFLFSSFIAIPLAAAIIYLGSAIIFFDPYLGNLTVLIAKILNPILDFLIKILTWLGSNQYSLLSDIYFSKYSLIFGLLACICVMIWLINRNYIVFLTLLASILIVVGEFNFTKLSCKPQELITIYDQYRGLTMDGFTTNGNVCYYIGTLDTSNVAFMSSGHRLNHFVKNINYKSIDSSCLMQIGSRILYVLKDRKDYLRLHDNQKIDYLIVNTSLKTEKIFELFQKIKPKVIILPRSLYPKTRNEWLSALDDFDIPIHDIAERGAFISYIHGKRN